MAKLHLPVELSDGRRLLFSVPSQFTGEELRAALQAEIATTFQAPFSVLYVAKMDGGDASRHLALSSGAVIGDLLASGDAVLAVEGQRQSGLGADAPVLSPQPALLSVADCATRWRVLERGAAEGRLHVAQQLAQQLAPGIPSECGALLASEPGLQLLRALAARPEPEVQAAAAAALAAALNDKLALEISLRGNSHGAASAIRDLCCSGDDGVRASANAVLKRVHRASRTAAPSEPLVQRTVPRAVGRKPQNIGGLFVDEQGRWSHEPSTPPPTASSGLTSVPGSATSSEGGLRGATAEELLAAMRHSGAGHAPERLQALQHVARLALNEEQRVLLVRCPGLVGTLVSQVEQPELFVSEATAPEVQRLAAKALANMATSREIRRLLLSNPRLQKLTEQQPECRDESAAVYLQMLQNDLQSWNSADGGK